MQGNYSYSDQTGRDLFLKGPVKVYPVVRVKAFPTNRALQGGASNPLATLLDPLELLRWQSREPGLVQVSNA